MKGKSTQRPVQIFSAIAAAFGLSLISGCGAGAPADTSAPVGGMTNIGEYEKRSEERPKADAGVDVKAALPEGVNMAKLKNLVASRTFQSRGDPFALLGPEKSYDLSQSAERLVQGGYMVLWEPPKDEVPEVIEPQPFRRLAGVMVGDSVLAIIDMGDGKMQIVRPGETIPGTEWTVVSIDTEKAVLRRSGNKKPKEVIVTLAGSLMGTGSSSAGRGNPGQGSGPAQSGSGKPGMSPGAPGAAGGG